MDAICLKCNNVISFRNQPGNRLSDISCKCGGKFSYLRIDWGKMKEFTEPVYPYNIPSPVFIIVKAKGTERYFVRKGKYPDNEYIPLESFTASVKKS